MGGSAKWRANREALLRAREALVAGATEEEARQVYGTIYNALMQGFYERHPEHAPAPGEEETPEMPDLRRHGTAQGGENGQSGSEAEVNSDPENGEEGTRTGSRREITGADDVRNMSDSDLADVVRRASENRDNISTNNMIDGLGYTGTPRIVSKEELKALAAERGSVSLYRNLYEYSRSSGRSPDPEMVNQFYDSDNFYNYMSQKGYRGAMVFYNDLGTAKQDGISMATTVGAVLNENARVIKRSNLYNDEGVQWVRSHPQTAAELGFTVETNSRGEEKVGSTGRNTSISYESLALAMGYNVIDNQDGASMRVLDRRALTTSRTNWTDAARDLHDIWPRSWARGGMVHNFGNLRR